MEKSDRRSEESHLWIPLQCLDQTLRAILKCLGLFHQDSPTTSSPGTSKQPKEEKEDVTMEKEEVVVTSRATKVKAKQRGKEKVSSGRPGQHN
ncbi:Elicitor peptide 1 [Arabidopsis thaliana]|uniref:Precursor of elicitor peptide 1 n=4 Tax=Arabidopsis TaxID=3701 RepID=PEP1_ARATH|nr:precursor of peptide 1 [Arabidopsis thaliana]Q9LV87.1 RecName: Full=Precursor of elicitor peptide 1; Contains: RecName: Full=Elicitor peptide 1; Short=AtPep1; Flags: Precursor [Arabidopsis thaliana]KAG7607328.1 Elicitor peptide [Arabidopsis thaliana x Arabidopsis arenosa]KAG7614231.1 Elicitor peptide [Arabidopsis suecica]AAL32908.1 Unknown protein [Arabidopsis thaliana]AAM10224.1 unknown protein [Arabidopsis thaliana]AED97966.1 precursor of peptide 1 [Arabidopsis thaliana]|eukprot:NP_569001.1 precursor of peptide 1 [Arabidopsis thaliana]